MESAKDELIKWTDFTRLILLWSILSKYLKILACWSNFPAFCLFTYQIHFLKSLVQCWLTFGIAHNAPVDVMLCYKEQIMCNR